MTSDGGEDLRAVRGYLDGLIRERLTSPISSDTPLVSLGFDSLAAIELWARLRTELGLDIQAAELLETTLAALTTRVRAEADAQLLATLTARATQSTPSTRG